MEIFVARQPIFDRNMNVFGYELLYRRSMNNFYEGSDDNKSTAELISNSFFALHFHELTEGKRAFINFSEEMLFKEIPLLLPKELITIEILERVENTQPLIEACKKLNQAGYMIALDDFIFDDTFLPLMEEVDIIKIEFPVISYEEQRELIQRYHHKIKFLAEKVETREEYQLALDMGYDYFQGYFFSKPVIIKGKDLPSINSNLIRIINELAEESPDYQKITEIIETDLGLSYKLLRMVNSVYFGTRNKIHSLKSALVRLGIEEIRKWIYLLMLHDIRNSENRELIKNSLIRAKMMELLSKEKGCKNQHFEFFMTGQFSSIDILLNQKMEDIMEGLALTDHVRDALLGVDNEISTCLEVVRCFEEANWSGFENIMAHCGIKKERFMEMYIDALKWVVKLES